MKYFTIPLLCLCILFPYDTLAQDDLDAKYATDMLKPGTKAPAILSMSNGKTVNILTQDKAKYTILEFWASWCGDCRHDMATMRDINRTYASDSIRIQGYSFDRDSTAWMRCVKDSVLTWTQALSPKQMRESDVAKAYNVKWIPSYYLLKDGEVILSTVMVEKLQARLKEIAPDAKSAK